MMLSRSQASWLEVAVKLAMDSTCRMQHGALIVRGSSVLGVGTNKFRNHPKWVTDYDNCSRHAEMVALRRVINMSDYVDLSKATLYVGRINREGKKRLSRPCDACWCELDKAGIRTMVFTTDILETGTMEKWK